MVSLFSVGLISVHVEGRRGGGGGGQRNGRKKGHRKENYTQMTTWSAGLV